MFGPVSFDVQRVVEYLALPSQGDLNTLSMVAAGVERDALAFTGWPSFLVAPYTHTFSLPEAANHLALPLYPVAQSPAPTVTVDGIALASGDFEVDFGPGLIYRVPPIQGWPPGRRHIVAGYSAGLAADPASMPADLVHAMVEQSAFAFKLSGPGGRLGRRRDSNDQGQVIQEYDLSDWGPGVVRTLRRYQLKRLG